MKVLVITFNSYHSLLLFSASTGDGNPLSLLSAAAAASEQSSCAVTPNLLVKDEPRDAPMEIDAMTQAAQMQNHLNGRLGVFVFPSIYQLKVGAAEWRSGPVILHYMFACWCVCSALVIYGID